MTRRPRTLYTALVAAAGTGWPMEQAARHVLDRIVQRATCVNDIAAALGVCDRSVRRLFKRYGMSATVRTVAPVAIPRGRPDVIREGHPVYSWCACAGCRRAA